MPRLVKELRIVPWTTFPSNAAVRVLSTPMELCLGARAQGPPTLARRRSHSAVTRQPHRYHYYRGCGADAQDHFRRMARRPSGRSALIALTKLAQCIFTFARR
jgi:hypothetical protein